MAYSASLVRSLGATWRNGADFLVVIAEVCGRRCRLIGAAGRPYVRVIHFHFAARAFAIGPEYTSMWIWVFLRFLTGPDSNT